MKDSKIEWTDHTGNLWHGCTEVSPGCTNCYARVLDHRWGRNNWEPLGPRMEVKSVWHLFNTANNEAAKLKLPKTVFVGSMMDIFEKGMPMVDSSGKPLGYTTDTSRRSYFNFVVTQTEWLIHLMLTKRPGNITKMIPPSWLEAPPDNLMFGTSPVDQPTADIIIPQLMKVNGKKFLSIEPQIGPVDFAKHMTIGNKVDWVIVGGESGGKKRKFNPDWARSIREQCNDLNIPFFMKQIDKVQEIPDDLLIREFPAFFKKPNQ